MTKEISEKKALAHCKFNQCKVLITIANACAMAARPLSATDSLHWNIGVDKDPQRAIDKAVSMCEKKYGVGKCGVMDNLLAPKYKNTYCSGYDYEAYNQQ